MATALFMEPGDVLLVEEYTYSHFVQCVALPRGYRVLPVAVDDDGIVPGALQAALEELAAAGTPAKMLYTVPVGQNPTGCTATLQRKQRVYDLCCHHSIMLLEDDPYAFLQFPDGPDAVPGLAGLRLDSYLSLDTAGLVIRLDSFAKCLAPGLRLGWASAAPAVARRLAMALQASTLGANMVCQAIVAEMLGAWGEEGLDAHLSRLQRCYAGRAAALQAAAEAELRGLAEWRRPTAGMFMVRW
jgi:kynurenine/2-aminoadipate aminotransferase